jgi:hypothetical protein
MHFVVSIEIVDIIHCPVFYLKTQCVLQKICVFSEDFASDSNLFLTILSMKQCVYVDVRPHMCGDSRCEKVNSLWLLVLCWLNQLY